VKIINNIMLQTDSDIASKPRDFEKRDCFII
jgi:hypothetical protein